MAANYTENLHLPQWDALDPFKRTEFNEAFAAIDESCGALQSGAIRMATGSYKGTNTTGQANPKTLTFDFKPQLVIVTYSLYVAIFTRGCNMASVVGSGDTTFNSFVYGWFIPNVTWGENSLSWYTTDGQNPKECQLNHSAYTYNYIAFGL